MSHTYVPNSAKVAGWHIRSALAKPLNTLPTTEFIRAWSAIAYLFPGLHPDGFEDAESGWPRIPKRFAKEAWRRADADEISDEELYPSDSVWAGIFDRMRVHLPVELERRVQLASEFGRV